MVLLLLSIVGIILIIIGLQQDTLLKHPLIWIGGATIGNVLGYIITHYIL